MCSIKRLGTEISRLMGIGLYPPVLGMQWVRGFNANRCVATKIKRKNYLRTYPTLLVFPDGSSVNVRYHEPRAIVKMPLMLEDLETEAERQAWSGRRRKRERVEIKEDVTEVNFDANKYLNLFKGRNK